MRKHLTGTLIAMAVAFIGAGLAPAPAGAATVAPVSDTVVARSMTVTPLDPPTGKVIGAPVTVAPSSDALHAAASFASGYGQGHPVAGGRVLVSVDITHRIGCIFDLCVSNYRHITQVDMTWVRDWHYIKANGWAKYVPVGSQWCRYDGPSQAYGGDKVEYTTAFWPYAGSGFHYRATAQVEIAVPMVGSAWGQDSTNIWLRSDGQVYWTNEH